MGKTKECSPLIKWAGGKRQLLDKIQELMPKEYNRYFEPFFGGGAVFFSIAPQGAVINDANHMLINMYRQIERDPYTIMDKLDSLEKEYNSKINDEERKVCYYTKRELFNICIREKDYSEDSAALFIFLNKTCFNGIYRENSKGFFNVPTGRKKTVKTYITENVLSISELLKNTIILNEDYKKACETAEQGDFVFFDPPYWETFSDYQKNGFGEEEHRNLAKLFTELTEKGVYCLLTNSNTDFVKALYSGYDIQVVSVMRNINRNGNGRTGEEVIIRNFK